MKQNFALTLSFDGIGLLHRAFPGWHLVGDVALDVADLSGELASLRQTAQVLDASGLRTKLVLPNDQIRYLTIDAPADEADTVDAVKAALDGATPYPVDDLAYDWARQDGQICIAAVARETLIEAEAFATEHQFNPVCFVAQPPSGDYTGEPFFGATLNANGQGITEEQIERDPAPIRVIGASKLPETAPLAEPPAEPDPETGPSSEDVSGADAADTPEPVVEDADETAADPDPVLADEDEAETEAASVAESESSTEAVEPSEAEPQDKAEDAAVAEPPEDDQEDTPEPQPTAFASIRAQRGDMGHAPRKLDGVLRNDAQARITLGAASEASADQPEPDKPVTVTGIAEASLPEDETDQPGHDIHPDAPEPEQIDSQVDDDTRLVLQDEVSEGPGPEFVAPPAVDAVPEVIPVVMPGPTPEPEPELAPAALTSQPSFFTRRSRRAKHAAGPALALDPADERQRMTVFGARERVNAPGKPRFLGLMLTAVLLLFLIGVAAWASIFLDDGIARFFRDDDPAVVATLPGNEDIAIEAKDENEVELASLEPEETLSVLDDPATEILSRVNPSDLSPDEAKARYAATGIWQLAPEPSDTPTHHEFEDVYQTSLDPDLNFQDAVALPDASDVFSDGVFFAPPAPPAADTTFTLDSRGFVLATPEGALTPDAVRVFAGRPALVPPSAAKPELPTTEPQADEAEAVPQLAAIRPRARPENAAEQIERNELSGRTRNELAALRPKLRPASAQEAAVAAAARALAESEAATVAAASTVDLNALEGAVAEAIAQPDPFVGATSQAVQASLKPNTRPRNFDTIVQRTKRNQDEDEAEPVRVAAAQKVTPKIPSTVNVAKRATERNALQFKRVNLIGVYGTPNNRRALVRMHNGRYKKVKVGDRLDGGRVSAIGDGDLRYKKGGRTVILKMPRG